MKIVSKKTDKKIFIEVKRQDGWVEGKHRSAGRGNAHERSNKYFSPGLMHILRENTGIKEPNLPFCVIFMGDITRDPARVREVTLWYGDYKNHFFMWRNTENTTMILRWFKEFVFQLIE